MRAAGTLILSVLCAFLLAGPAARSQDDTAPAAPGEDTQSPGSKELNKKTRAAIAKGMEYLISQQDKTSGSFGQQNKIAATSLAGMALLSGGNLPGRGKYCKNVRDALRFITEKAAQSSGYIQIDGSNMYSHGFATLFLAESYGTVPPYEKKMQQQLRKTLKAAVRLLEKSQNPEGGWWYNPLRNSGGAGADISVTVCETNALRAARNCGISVDKRVIENALKCVKRGANPDGGFSYRVYMHGGDGSSMVPRSSGAVCILQGLGAYDAPEAKKGIEYVMKTAISSDGKYAVGMYTYYTTYYFAQAAFMAGKEYWQKAWPAMQDFLLKNQQADGCWQGEGGQAYGTAIALIVLQMPYRYLPIYQEGIENGSGASE